METYDDYSKEIRMINKFKKTNQSLLKPNKVARKSTDEPKSCRLLKLLLLNAEKITETVREQQEKIENTIKGLETELEKSEINFMQELKNFSDEFSKLKENINEKMSNKKSKSVLEYFQVKQETNCRKKDVNNVEILNLVSKNKGYRGVKEIIEKCDEKVKALRDLKEKVKSSVIDEEFLGNKRKSERDVNKKKSVSSSDEEKETTNRDNKDNRSPLLKMCINYFNKNKPTSSILIPHRKRIFVNYYLDDSKRTTKSFNIAHVSSLKEFKNLLEEVKHFIRTHKVTKE